MRWRWDKAARGDPCGPTMGWGRLTGHMRQHRALFAPCSPCSQSLQPERTGWGKALDDVDIGGTHELKGGRISHVGQRWNDEQRCARAGGVVAGGGEPAARNPGGGMKR